LIKRYSMLSKGQHNVANQPRGILRRLDLHGYAAPDFRA